MNKEIKETKIDKADEGQYETIKDANFITFSKIGEAIEGMLEGKEQSDRYGFGLYTLRTKDGERKKFHGTKQLDDLMTAVNIHDYIIVTYIDNESLPQGTLKLFDVKRKKE